MVALLLTEAHILKALRARGLFTTAIADWTIGAGELLHVTFAGEHGGHVTLLPSQWKAHATPVDVQSGGAS